MRQASKCQVSRTHASTVQASSHLVEIGGCFTVGAQRTTPLPNRKTTAKRQSVNRDFKGEGVSLNLKILCDSRPHCHCTHSLSMGQVSEPRGGKAGGQDEEKMREWRLLSKHILETVQPAGRPSGQPGSVHVRGCVGFALFFARVSQ